MGNEHNQLLETAGYLVPASRKRPSNLDEAIADAITEHCKVHKSDGVSLFLFGTLSPSGSQGYLYPVSAVDADYAFHIAQILHGSRGLPAGLEWSLLFFYPAGSQDSVA